MKCFFTTLTCKIGDTVKGYLETFWTEPDIVQSVDSVLVGNTYRKRWSINPCYYIDLIEGVGSTYGLLVLSPGCITDMADYSINCFQQEGITLYPENVTDCPLITSIPNINFDLENVIVFPNPSHGSFTIWLNGASIKEICLTDLSGNTIIRKRVNNQSEIKITGLKSGIYFLSLIDSDYISIERKIICSC